MHHAREMTDQKGNPSERDISLCQVDTYLTFILLKDKLSLHRFNIVYPRMSLYVLLVNSEILGSESGYLIKNGSLLLALNLLHENFILGLQGSIYIKDFVAEEFDPIHQIRLDGLW